jgi:hypothetical protein
MRKILLLAILILFGTADVCVAGSTFRCGPHVVSVGATKTEVLGKCGEPTSKEYLGEQKSGGFTSTTRERARRDRSTSGTRGTYTERSFVVESWTYNCGPSEFSQTLTFQGQDLIEVQSVGYGYGQSDCIGRENRTLMDQGRAPAKNPPSSDSRQSGSSDEAKEQAPAKGSISVQGSPPGAKIYINGHYVASLPAVLYEIEPGAHSIEVQHKGYKTHKEWVKVQADGVATVIIELERE